MVFLNGCHFDIQKKLLMKDVSEFGDAVTFALKYEYDATCMLHDRPRCLQAIKENSSPFVKLNSIESQTKHTSSEKVLQQNKSNQKPMSGTKRRRRKECGFCYKRGHIFKQCRIRIFSSMNSAYTASDQNFILNRSRSNVVNSLKQSSLPSHQSASQVSQKKSRTRFNDVDWALCSVTCHVFMEDGKEPMYESSVPCSSPKAMLQS